MKIVFMGTPNAAVPTLRRIIDDGHQVVAVYTQPDRASGRGKRISFSPVKEFALASNIPVFQPVKIKAEETVSEFVTHQADVAVVVAYGRILPIAYLDAFRFGAVNVHFSLLPKFRGAAPVNWAIVNGERVTGVTTMRMNVGLDTGDIYLQSETEIGEGENSIQLMDRLALTGAELLSETLKLIDGLSSVKQDHELATYAPIMKKEDGLIDWSLRAKAIRNQIRGFQPFPSSFSFYQGKRVTVFSARESEIFDADRREPGTIHVDGKELHVNCGSGTALMIDEIQIEGKRRGSASDLINGARIKTGDVFTSVQAK